MLFACIFLEEILVLIMPYHTWDKLKKNKGQIHENYILIYLMRQVNKKIYFFPSIEHSAY